MAGYLVTPQEMRRLDALTCEREAIDGFALMQRAASRLGRTALEKGLMQSSDRVICLCGPGNNGGDGLGIAAHLREAGYETQAYIIGDPARLSKESGRMLEKIEADVPVQFLDSTDVETQLRPALEHADVVVDALLGIGLESPLEGAMAKAVRSVNKARVRVVSIDLPSGLHAGNGLALGDAIKADHTLIVQHFKGGNLLGDALDYQGERSVVDVGILHEDVPLRQYVDVKTFKGSIPPRRRNTHKYHYGSILVAGGAEGMRGAVTLAASAALRSGAGLVRAAYFKGVEPFPSPPEVMASSYRAAEELPLEGVHSVCFGVGAGLDAEQRKTLKRLLEADVPLLVDADGLSHLRALEKGSASHRTVLTPHAGELSRLLDTDAGSIVEDPLGALEKAIQKTHSTILLKGPVTLIAQKGRFYAVETGHPGMATAGSGDVLSGVITSLMGSGREPFEAAALGAIVHGEAGRLAVKEVGEEGMLSGDIIRMIPTVLETFKAEAGDKTSADG